MILQQTTPQNPFARILCAIAAFFGTGIALLLLMAFYDALVEYKPLFMRFIAFCVIVLLLALVAYVVFNVFLSIQHRATENLFFMQSRQELQVTDKSQLGNDSESDTERKILDLYHEMNATDSLSLNQLALEVYGKKGGYYNDKIREILSSYNITV